MPLARLAIAASFWLAAAACLRDRASSSGAGERNAQYATAAGPSLRLIDTVVLAETDSLHLGRPGQTFAVDDHGAFYVPDELQDHVVRFAPTGVPNLLLGNRGRGPGELEAVGATFVIDTFVAQFHSTRRVAVYSGNSGALITSRLLRGYSTSIAVSAGRAWIGTFDLDSRHGLAVVSTAAFFRAPGDSDYAIIPATAAAFPRQYAQFPGLDIYNYVSAAPIDRGVMVGFAGGTNDLYVVDSLSHVTDTVEVPIARRRGFTPKALALFSARSRADFVTQLVSASALYGLWPASKGRIVVWHEDNSAVRTRKGQPGAFSGRAYLSILSPNGAAACVDAEVPFPGSHWPRLAFARDTVFALDQVVPDSGPPRVYSVVRRYALDDEHCDWLPTTRSSE